VIHIERCPAPDVLVNPKKSGLKEHERAMRHFTDPATRNQKFDFRAYKLDEVKEALWTLFSGKCAYCESKLEVIYPVEHFRPKSVYYWLASTWSNLLPSCTDCNTLVKLDLFPLQTGSTRAQHEGEESAETPLLINPCQDEPTNLLEFVQAEATGDVVLREAAGCFGLNLEKAQESIRLYSLNTKPLVDRRRDAMIPIQGAIRRITRNMTRLEAKPGKKRKQELLEEIKEDLDFLRPYEKTIDKEFSGMVRQELRKQPWWRVI
jgi:uncharacterized protein (TIGR02646 family)